MRPLLPLCRWLRGLVFALALLGLEDAHTAIAADLEWRQIKTPEFTVLSQLEDKSTRQWAEEFNQFIAELRRLFQTERSHLAPLTVVLFAYDRDFARYKPLRPDGRAPAAVAGVFNHYPSWSVIGLSRGYRRTDTRALIFHEGVHWFLSADPVSYPLWLSEGLAEVFSTFRQERGKVRWGADLPAHVRRLRTEPMLPFERFLYLTTDDPLFNADSRTGMFYAQAWVFVHYLLFGAHSGSREAISHYFDVLAAGAHPDDAFKQAFGHDYDAMARTLSTYVRTGHYEMRIRPESPAAQVTVRSTEAPACDVEIALGRLALAVERDEVARSHAVRAIALEPEQPGGHEILAQLAERAGDFAGSLAASARAVELGSGDASTLFLLAYRSAASALAAGEMDAARAGEIAALYQRAIAASPTMEEAYLNLAALAPALDPIMPEHLATLKRGARMFERRGEIVLGLATLIERNGDRASAQKLVAEARRRGLRLELEDRAQLMEDRWLYADVLGRIEALAQSGDLPAALALCGEAIPRLEDLAMRTALVRLHESLTARHWLAEAHAADRAGDVARARQLYNDARRAPGASPSLRRHIDERLARLPPESVAASANETIAAENSIPQPATVLPKP